jgi:putative membrane protein
MNRYARWGFAIALMPLAACASHTPPATPPAPPGPPPLAASDAAFIQTAAQGGMAEIQTGQLAEQTSKSRAVKAFAEHMIKDHTANNDQLKQIATTKGATVPASVNDEQQATMTKLQGEKGRKFDHDYIAAQVQGHEQMLSAFQTEASSGTDPDLKSFAAQTVPVIQEHLKDAEKLAGPAHGKMMHHHHKSSAS